MSFVVWKRSDGHVDCSCYVPRDYKQANGEMTTYEVLKVFESWDGETVDFIMQHRGELSGIKSIKEKRNESINT